MARKKIATDESPPVGGDSVLTDILVDSLNKQLGDVAFILGKNDTPSDVKEWISTGSTVLDTIISNNGVLQYAKSADHKQGVYGYYYWIFPNLMLNFYLNGMKG